MTIERSNIRQTAYSNWKREVRHKTYGFDHDMNEYDSNANNVGMFEIKHGNEPIINLNSFQFKCLQKDAEKLGVPFFLTVYYPPYVEGSLENIYGSRDTIWQFYVYPINNRAKDFFNKYSIPNQMTEYQYSFFLCKLRNDKFTGILIDNTTGVEYAANNQRIEICIPQITI